jgi:60 kDa SS-A/Ro ribonucleoprotein
MVRSAPVITCRDGAAVMALVSAKAESRYHIMGFSTKFVDLKISPRMRLDDVIARMNGLPFAGTDCSLPPKWAIKNDIEVDAVVVMTDNETWAGESHPCQSLNKLRAKLGKPVKQVVVGMEANPFTIADPSDLFSMDMVGFDTAAPAAISEFIRL